MIAPQTMPDNTWNIAAVVAFRRAGRFDLPETRRDTAWFGFPRGRPTATFSSTPSTALSTAWSSMSRWVVN
tara:strand:- start:23080 stop:23292 length:213 start_codon:yes stop_codon:yes gene_type:complete